MVLEPKWLYGACVPIAGPGSELNPFFSFVPNFEVATPEAAAVQRGVCMCVNVWVFVWVWVALCVNGKQGLSTTQRTYEHCRQTQHCTNMESASQSRPNTNKSPR